MNWKLFMWIIIKKLKKFNLSCKPFSMVQQAIQRNDMPCRDPVHLLSQYEIQPLCLVHVNGDESHEDHDWHQVIHLLSCKKCAKVSAYAVADNLDFLVDCSQICHHQRLAIEMIPECQGTVQGFCRWLYHVQGTFATRECSRRKDTWVGRSWDLQEHWCPLLRQKTRRPTHDPWEGWVLFVLEHMYKFS